METVAEQRKHIREDLTDPAGFRPIHAIPAQLMDISATGVGLTSKTTIPMGTPVEIVLLDNTVTVNGTVKNIEASPNGGYRIGLSFAEPQTDLAELICAARRNQH